MTKHVLKVKQWDEVKKLAQENGVKVNKANLKNRGKWGEYIASSMDKNGCYWYYGVQYYPWMVEFVTPEEILKHGEVIKEYNLDGITSKIIVFCDVEFCYEFDSNDKTLGYMGTVDNIYEIHRRVNV